MTWECACGISNRDNAKDCSGCGWTREKSDDYIRKSKESAQSINDNRIIDPELEKAGRYNCKIFHFIIYGMTVSALLIIILIIIVVIIQKITVLQEIANIMAIILTIAIAILFIASFVYFLRISKLLKNKGISISIFWMYFPVLMHLVTIKNARDVGWWPKGGIKQLLNLYRDTTETEK